MKVKNLTQALKIAKEISNPASLTSIFRAVELKDYHLLANSEYGNIHLLLPESTGIVNPVLLETEALLSISSSLSPEADITFEEKPTHVTWDCKNDKAKGKLNFVVTDHKVVDVDHLDFSLTPPKHFGKALELGTLACQSAALSFGLYGVEVTPVGDKLQIMSSNVLSCAATEVDKGNFPDKKFTLRPPIPKIIKSILETFPDSTLDIADDGIYILNNALMAKLPLGVALEQNIKDIADGYRGTNKVIPLDAPAVKKFVSRAKNLTDRQVSFSVTMKIQEGSLLLEHKGISSSSEQHFIAEGLDPTINYEGFSLPGDLVMVALENVNQLVCDYLSVKQLVLRGSEPNFLYIVGGNETHG